MVICLSYGPCCPCLHHIYHCVCTHHTKTHTDSQTHTHTYISMFCQKYNKVSINILIFRLLLKSSPQSCMLYSSTLQLFFVSCSQFYYNIWNHLQQCEHHILLNKGTGVYCIESVLTPGTYFNQTLIWPEALICFEAFKPRTVAHTDIKTIVINCCTEIAVLEIKNSNVSFNR